METKKHASPITGKEGAEIKLNVAADWTKNHRERHPDGIISQFFGVEVLQQILQQPGCMGIRIYYANSQQLSKHQLEVVSKAHAMLKAADAIGETHLVLTGVTKEGTDLLPAGGKVEVAAGTAAPQLFKANAVAAPPAGVIVEQAMPCPGGAGCPQNALTGAN